MKTKHKILIVEDEAVNRIILNNMLKNNYDTLQASNGQVALDIIAKENNIAAIILDLYMPIMNGYEFLDEIKKRNLRKIPILVVTGENDKNKEADILSRGAWDFTQKPFNPKIISVRLENIIQRSEMNIYKEMERALSHDSITGLHNRSRMYGKTKEMLQNNPDKDFIFIRVDIDRFHLYNASFGEEAGNELIKYVANALKDIIKDYDLCEYGHLNADIFAICRSYDGDKNFIIEASKKIQDSLYCYKENYLIECSVGVYEIKDKTDPIETYYQKATLASKKIKRKYGEFISFYDDKMSKDSKNELWIINEMQNALANEQFEIYIQPKINLKYDSCSGGEALVRWIHPTKGLISPGIFIPVFETNGFISNLDYYVWQKTCKILSDWKKTYKKPYPISVNISRVSLYNPNLVEEIIELCDKYDIERKLLQLEITESTYMSNQDLMEDTISRFKKAGFTLLMDDFGSGYSSLNTLKEIDVDVLKIDMKFLSKDEEDSKSEIILSSIIKMADWLGMETIVEGVETKSQRDFIKATGCNHVQGYYYSKPIPVKNFTEKYYSKTELEAQLALKKEKTIVSSKVLLVIDDDETTREIIKEYFKSLYTIVEKSSVEDALLYLRESKSNVYCILVDNVMKKMSGMDFLVYCQDIPQLAIIPKVMITGFDNYEDKIRAFNLGAYDYISKPLVKEIVISRVKHIMDAENHYQTFIQYQNNHKLSMRRDSLTNLLDKESFRQNAQEFINNNKDSNFAVIVLDIDNFKYLNDEYGHLNGDEALKILANVLKSSFRKHDFIARFGGDEFVILVTNIPNHEIVKYKANYVIKQIGILAARDLHISLSVSIGLSFNNGLRDLGSLFERADKALYQAKENGKGQVVVYGETIPQISDNDKPIILLCGENPNVYPEITMYLNDSFIFKSIISFEELKHFINSYEQRIALYCLEMKYSNEPDASEFLKYIRNNSATKPIISICQESDMQLITKAVLINALDIITWPLEKNVVQRKLQRALKIKI